MNLELGSWVAGAVVQQDVRLGEAEASHGEHDREQEGREPGRATHRANL
jgi:hypothetical protein